MKRECETCIKRKTIYSPNYYECYDTKEMPHYQNRIMLLEENQKYKEVIDKAIMYINSARCKGINGLKKYSIKEFWFVKEIEDILKEVE